VIKLLASDSLPSGNALQDSSYPYVFGDFTLLDNFSKKIVDNVRKN